MYPGNGFLVYVMWPLQVCSSPGGATRLREEHFLGISKAIYLDVIETKLFVLLKGPLILYNLHAGIVVGGVDILEVAVSQGIIKDDCAWELSRGYLLQLVQYVLKSLLPFGSGRIADHEWDLVPEFIVYLAQQSLQGGKAAT